MTQTSDTPVGPERQGFAVLAKAWLRSLLPKRKTVKRDTVAGLVLGVESVPDGLALGVLAGVNPLSGLYGYMFGMFGGATTTRNPVLAVQVTGATALIVADANLQRFNDPARALYMLAIMAGVVMIIAGILGAGKLLRFVSSAVMVGLIAGVGVNTILGQLGNFTGFDAHGTNRILRALDLLAHAFEIDLATFGVGMVTLLLIVLLNRTALGALGMVLAIVIGSVASYALGNFGIRVATVGDVAGDNLGLPLPALPEFGVMLELIVPALAIALVGMVQGAGITTAFPGDSGKPPNASRDFIGQGVGAVLSGIMRGLPASGSMSATALNVQAGAKTRFSLFVAFGVMVTVVLLLGDLVGFVSFPALAALLMIVGFGTIRPALLLRTFRTGKLQAAVMLTTFVLTILFPVYIAVLVGVALAVLLFVVEQSQQLSVRRLEFSDGPFMREVDPPATIAGNEIVMLQPYGNLFFASADSFKTQLPEVTKASSNSVVILRLRGIDDLGVSVSQILVDYAKELAAQGSHLFVNGGEALYKQMKRSGALAAIGDSNFFLSGEWHGKTLAKAYAEAGKVIRGEDGEQATS